jgi:hypothetical protein
MYNMRNARYLIILIFIAMACGDDDNVNTNSKTEEVKDIATKGRWRISYFFDTDKDETDNFNGYVFQFSPGGALTASNGSNSHSGSWSVTDEDSTDDSNDYEDIDFNISFAASPDFAELSEDWEILSVTNLKIELRHVSGGGGGTDLLTFDKIQ